MPVAGTAAYLSQDVHKCVEDIERSISLNGCARYVIEGEASAGKSSVLRQLQQRLSIDRNCVIHLAPPARALDSGPCALLSFAGQLHDECPHPHRLEEFLELKSLEKRFELLEEWVGQLGSRRLIVLADEPEQWPGEEQPSDAAFAEHTLQVTRFLASLNACHVITGRVPSAFPWRRDRHYQLKLRGKNTELLQDESVWNDLAQCAQELSRRLGEDAQSFSPLEVRLMVGLQRFAPESLGEALAEQTGLQDLFRRFLENVPASSRLRAVWRMLSLCRTSFSSTFLKAVEERCNLSEPDRTLLRACLLYQEVTEWVLHPLLRSREKAAEDLHSDLALFYSDERQQTASRAADLQAEAEGFYHSASSGRVMDSCRCYFVEQLNLWGKVLSHSLGNYEAAAGVFQQSLAWNPEDAYANHYYAFNLDMLARSQDTIETHYRKAVEIRPEHPWYHSRLICFLLSVARNREAKGAWTRALDYPLLPQSYRELHLWVLRVLLHRGQLDFARDVLDSISSEALDQTPEFRVLRQQWEAQKLAQTHGAFVPSPLLQDGWWQQGPFRLPLELKSGHKLKQWMAARLEGLAGDTVTLRAAVIEPGQAALPPVHMVELERDVLSTWQLPEEYLRVGAFLEIGAYESARGNTQNRAMFHQPDSHPLLTLPSLRPDPDRYARNAL